MSITQQVQADITSAMKAGDKQRVAALRLVLSELQKDEKEGKGDAVAVLRRERKRREESAATYEENGRPELAGPERYEAELLASYLPAELSDDELAGLVRDAIAQTGASSPKDLGRVMPVVLAAAGGRADGGRVSALVREALA
ncbi:GatB/YqeY domain-containing protein [Patulibacter sp. SYSU D01012]|uniref:GatB/YqeY domain-containing protein n=1 Tax=Patulibacter sp. SYSU D01012 TaxID=2817381 RepID=UPI001B300B9E|nr:GatB/YqeY domain-containing protein [Patulibacter sp. SYSU D01012]